MREQASEHIFCFGEGGGSDDFFHFLTYGLSHKKKPDAPNYRIVLEL